MREYGNFHHDNMYFLFKSSFFCVEYVYQIVFSLRTGQMMKKNNIFEKIVKYLQLYWSRDVSRQNFRMQICVRAFRNIDIWQQQI